MEGLLRKTIDVLSEINTDMESCLISEQDVTEEKRNVRDFIILKNKINMLLDQLQDKNNWDNQDYMNKRLIDLHVRYADAIWHLDQIHELIIKVIKKYPDN